MANTQSQYIQQNTQIGTQIRTLEDTISELDKNILSLTYDIATTDASIHTKELSISTYQLDMRKARMQVVQNKEVILQYLSHIYDSGNMVYDASQDIDMVRTIVLTDDLSSDVFADIEYKSILSGMGQTLVEEYRKNIRQYYRMTVLLADDIAALDTMKSNQIANKAELENTKKARTELLETTK
jgi:septal ring factor EnvC (AmiA/AmiB activator)